MKKVFRKGLLLITMAMVLTCLCSFTSFAKTKTVKVKKAGFTTVTAEADNVAKTVSTGSMKVKVKGSGYLKFTAAKTKTYSFKISNVKGKRYTCGFTYVMTTYGTDNKYIQMSDLATQGGTADVMFVATRNSKSGQKSLRYLKSRTGKIALSAGQTVYLYFNFSSSASFKYKIK